MTSTPTGSKELEWKLGRYHSILPQSQVEAEDKRSFRRTSYPWLRNDAPDSGVVGNGMTLISTVEV